MGVQFGRCTSNKLDRVPIVDGQILYVKDTKEQYLDIDSSRIKITDLVFVSDIAERDAIANPSPNKLYYIIDLNSVQFYINGHWQGIYYVDMQNILTKDNTTPYTPTGDYNPATKKYVDDTILKDKIKQYQKTFTIEDWVLNGQEYVLTIPQSEHNLNNPYVLALYMLEGTEYKSVNMYGSKLLPNGNLVIVSDLQYSGRILLKEEL